MKNKKVTTTTKQQWKTQESFCIEANTILFIIKEEKRYVYGLCNKYGFCDKKTFYLKRKNKNE